MRDYHVRFCGWFRGEGPLFLFDLFHFDFYFINSISYCLFLLYGKLQEIFKLRDWNEQF
jgi:hypothetical protein